MIYKDYLDIDPKKEKLYEHGKEYKKFKDIDEDALKVILEQASKIRSNQKNFISNVEFYASILDRLTYDHFFSYDEKICLLINSIDPDLSEYKLYIKTHIIPKKEIDETSEVLVKNILISKREKELTEYQRKVRSTIGIYDAKLLSYERDYFRKFPSDTLESNISADYTSQLLEIFKLNPVKVLSDDRIENIKGFVQEYKESVVNFSYKDLVFHIINQPNILNIKNASERLIFYIFAVDPELEALKIYEKENNWNTIKDQLKNKIGFYSKDLIYIEKLYQELYIPEFNVNLFK